MKRIAFYCLLYGREFLAWSIRSIQDAVDEIHCVYTDRPSFGYNTDLVCPDTEDELKAEAHRFLNKPLFWHRGRWPNESAHRDAIYPIARDRGADQILVVDADELWDPETAKAALDTAAARPERRTLVRFMHFWRSLKWVCRDEAMPVRILNVKGTVDNPPNYLSPQRWPVFHMGYAQSSKLVRYKWAIHGHLSEMRPGWLESKFLGWKPGVDDVHPTNEKGFWNPAPVDAATAAKLAELVADHPYLGVELIP